MSDQLCTRVMYMCFAMAGVILGHGLLTQQSMADGEADTMAYRGSGRIEFQAQR